MQNLYSADTFSPVEKPQEDEEEAEGHRRPTGLNVEHFQEVSHGLHRVKGRPRAPLAASYDKLKDPVGEKEEKREAKERPAERTRILLKIKLRINRIE